MPLNDALERRLAALIAANDVDGASEALVRGYGPEILSFLIATIRDADDADEAFATFSEHVWRGIASFRRDSSFRTWSYTIAKNAARDLFRASGRRAKRFEGGGTTAADRVAWEVRSSTNAFRRTDVKDKVRALREALKPDERELLLLRVDRALEWNEIAEVLGEDAATLRKRFERTKEKLKVLAQRAGVLSS